MDKKLKNSKQKEAEWFPKYNIWNEQTGFKCSTCGYCCLEKEAECRWCKAKMTKR